MKNVKRFWPLLIVVLISFPTLFLLQENLFKGLFIITLLLLWSVVSIKTNRYVLTTLLFTIFVLPFNLTLLLPTIVEVFDTVILEFSPYVDGLYSNYLVPTVYILDILLLLLLLSFLFEKGKNFIICRLSDCKYLFGGLIVFLLLQNIFLFNPVIILKSLRLITHLLVFLLTSNWIKNEWEKRYFKYVILTLLPVLLIQGIIGILQFNGGSSLGLTFLGESQVVNGMQGSSFISLNDGIYLRSYGTFPHPNVLGGLYILSFVLGWISSINLKKSWKYLGWFVMVLSVLFSLFTFSRIAISVLIFGVLVFVLSRVKKENLFAIYPTMLFERFMNLLGGDTSWNDRVELFKTGLGVFKNNWVLGSGFGNFVSEMGSMVPRTSNGVLLLQPVHNVPMLIFAEFGLFGGILFLCLMFKYLIQEVVWKKETLFKMFVVFALVMIGLFDHYLLTLPQGMVIGMLLTCSLFF